MTNFERRLTAIQKRPSLGSGGGVTVVLDQSSTLGWQAAERISHILDVAPGSVIKLAIESGSDAAVLEVCWDADGLAMIREI